MYNLCVGVCIEVQVPMEARSIQSSRFQVELEVQKVVSHLIMVAEN